MQISILSGVYSDASPDFRTSYPHNLLPVPKEQGISAGYLKQADGIKEFAIGPGADRGGINWRGACYRVMGSDLVRVNEDKTVDTIGSVGVGGYCAFDYSFTHLGVASGGRLYLYDGTTLTQVTDPDLGGVKSFVWIDGYFLTTDGTNLVVTELNDPFSVNPLKYGSSEIDPDEVLSVLEFGNEIYAVNRYSIEAFNNTGGSNFPFSRIDGAEVARGAVGTHAACIYDDKIAFVGGGKKETHGVHQYANGGTVKISSREIDLALSEYDEAELANIVVEARENLGNSLLYIHLPDQCLVFDIAASRVMETLVWSSVSGGTNVKTAYPARGFVFVYGTWLAGHESRVGEMDRTINTQFGELARWEFGTTITYNEGRGAIFHALDLVCLTQPNDNSVIETSYSLDGVSFSQPKTSVARKKTPWRRLGNMEQTRLQRFRGTANVSIARLEASLEGLAV